jgi:hypothetical protein
MIPDVPRVMESLGPEQKQMLDQWAYQVQSLVNTALAQAGPAATRFKNWMNGVWLGLLDGDCVECPLHGTQFSLVDGSVRRGPGTTRARVFEARIRNGNVEVRSLK